jgi:hypothetical protein
MGIIYFIAKSQFQTNVYYNLINIVWSDWCCNRNINKCIYANNFLNSIYTSHYYLVLYYYINMMLILLFVNHLYLKEKPGVLVSSLKVGLATKSGHDFY